MLDIGADSRSIGMDQIRPESPPILCGHRVQAQVSPIPVHTNSLTGGKTRSELSPSLGKSPVVHQDEIESGLMSAMVQRMRHTKIWVSTS